MKIDGVLSGKKTSLPMGTCLEAILLKILMKNELRQWFKTLRYFPIWYPSLYSLDPKSQYG
jgi:hypothetical protein